MCKKHQVFLAAMLAMMLLTYESVPKGLIAGGDYALSAIKEDGTIDWVQLDSPEFVDLSTLKDIVFIDSDTHGFIAIDKNGKVFWEPQFYSYSSIVNTWENIVDVSIGFYHVVGLTSSGDVNVAYVDPHSTIDKSECDIYDWTDIKDIEAGVQVTIGLKSDGTVVAAGQNKWCECNVSNWTDIVSISAEQHTVGLKSDGTVVATGYNNDGQCNVSGWTDIVAIATNSSTTFGLKSDGTVVSAGGNKSGYGSETREWDVADLKDIVAIAADYGTFVGLKSDGTVVVKGEPTLVNTASTWTGLKTSNYK